MRFDWCIYCCVLGWDIFDYIECFFNGCFAIKCQDKNKNRRTRAKRKGIWRKKSIDNNPKLHTDTQNCTQRISLYFSTLCTKWKVLILWFFVGELKRDYIMNVFMTLIIAVLLKLQLCTWWQLTYWMRVLFSISIEWWNNTWQSFCFVHCVIDSLATTCTSIESDFFFFFVDFFFTLFAQPQIHGKIRT